jgi:hypothetical protein
MVRTENNIIPAFIALVNFGSGETKTVTEEYLQ